MTRKCLTGLTGDPLQDGQIVDRIMAKITREYELTTAERVKAFFEIFILRDFLQIKYKLRLSVEELGNIKEVLSLI